MPNNSRSRSRDFVEGATDGKFRKPRPNWTYDVEEADVDRATLDRSIYGNVTPEDPYPYIPTEIPGRA